MEKIVSPFGIVIEMGFARAWTFLYTFYGSRKWCVAPELATSCLVAVTNVFATRCMQCHMYFSASWHKL